MLEDLYHHPAVKLRLKKTGIDIETNVVRFEKDRIFLELKDEFKSYLDFFTEGREVGMTIYTSARVIELKSIVIDVEEGSNKLVMEIHDEYSIIQRRKFVRTDVKYKVSLANKEMILDTTTVNIGGGGVCLRGNEQLKIGETYYFTLLIPSIDDAIEGKGVIINKVECNDEIHAMFSFSEITKEMQNKIVGLCFEKEFNK